MRIAAVLPLAVFVIAILLLHHRLYRRPLPRVAGVAEVDGVGAPVEVTRDRWGTVHVTATCPADAAFAVGLAHGQDRGWQLEWYRRLGGGRLATLVGPAAEAADRTVAELGIPAAARADAEALQGDARELLEAYAAGVRAAAAAQPRPLELALLRRDREPWSPVDSIAVLRLTLFGLSGAGAALSPEVAQWFPVAGVGGDGTAVAVAGSGTVSGRPLLATDLAGAATAPSPWYALRVDAGEVFAAAGVTVPGVPLPLVGHGRGVAWGVVGGAAGAELVAGVGRPAPRLITGLLAMAAARTVDDWAEAATPLGVAPLRWLAVDTGGAVRCVPDDAATGPVTAIAGDGSDGSYRALRVHQLLDTHAAIDATYLRRVQMDIVDPVSALLAGLLDGVRVEDTLAEEARAAVARWDGSMSAAATEPTVAVAIGAALLRTATAAAGAPAGGLPALLRAWQEGDTAPLGGRAWSDVVPEAVTRAVQDLRRNRGGPRGWRWGRSQEVRLRHPLTSRRLLAALVRRRALETGGAATTVLRVVVDARGGDVPGCRMVLDPGDWDAASLVMLPGQSGHPGSRHWDDAVEDWLRNRQHPLGGSTGAVDGVARSRLVLRPRAEPRAARRDRAEVAS